MNSEIERLAKESGGEVEEYTTHMWTTAEQWCFTPDELAKFAALVAEECAKEADHWGAIGKGPHPEHVCGQYIGATIRAKFALSELKDAAK